MIKIDELIKNAMHEKNLQLLNVFKLIKTEFVKKETEPGRTSKELTEQEQIGVLMKMASQREESISKFVEAKREDLADKERYELGIISDFIPKQPTEEEIKDYTKIAITQYVEQNDGIVLSMKDMKPIMEIIKAKYPMVNGKIVSQVLKETIS